MNRRVFLLSSAALASVAASPRRAYERLHREWTRELVLYWESSTALMLRATLLEPAFREALAAERQRLLNPDAANQAEFEARMRDDAAKYVEIVFAADSAFPEAEKFGPGDDRWNLAVRADGQDQPLVAVDRVRKPSPLHEALYLQQNIWSELWIARFSRTIERPRTVELRVGGGFGNGACTWELG